MVFRAKTQSLSQPRWPHCPRPLPLPSPSPAQPQGPRSVFRGQKPYLYKTHALSANIHTHYFRGGKGLLCRGVTRRGHHSQDLINRETVVGAGEGGPQREWGKEKEAVPVADWRAQRWGRSRPTSLPNKPQRGPALCPVSAPEDAPADQDGDPCPSPGRRQGNIQQKSMRLFTSQRVGYVKNDRSLYKIIKLFQ